MTRNQIEAVAAWHADRLDDAISILDLMGGDSEAEPETIEDDGCGEEWTQQSTSFKAA